MTQAQHVESIIGVTIIAAASLTRVGLLAIIAVRSKSGQHRRVWLSEVAFLLALAAHQGSVAVDLYEHRFGAVAAHFRFACGVAALIAVVCVVLDIGRIVATLNAGQSRAIHDMRNQAEEKVLQQAIEQATQSNRRDRELDNQTKRKALVYISEALREQSVATLNRRRQCGGA